jgi:hypothetical protein
VAHGHPKRRYLYLPDGWDDGWRTARKAAKGGTGYARCMLVGDSIAEGQPNSSEPAFDSYTNSFFGRIESGLVAKGLPLAARAFGTNESLARHATYNWTALGGAPWLVNTAANNNAGYCQVMGSSVVGAFPANIAMQFNGHVGAVQIDFLHALWFNSSTYFSYRHNNSGSYGAAVEVQRGTVAQYKSQTLSLAGLNPTNATTVQFGLQLASDHVTNLGNTLWMLAAIERYRLDYGLQTTRFAWSGRTAGDFGRADSTPPQKMAQLLGGYDGTNWDAVGFPFCPHLAVLEPSINDCNQSNSPYLDPGGMYAAYCAFADYARRGRPNMSILVVIPFYPLPSASPNAGDSTGWTNNVAWQTYQHAIREACKAKNMAYLDVAAAWESTGVARGYVSALDAHWMNAGHQWVATQILGLV